MKRPGVLVLARAPGHGSCGAALRPHLGDEACGRLHAVLARRTVAWAREVAGDRVLVVCHPAAGAGSLRALLGPGIEVAGAATGHAGERVAEAVRSAFDRFGAPLLVSGTRVPRLTGGHARAALADLAAGADATFGPALQGGLYLAGLSDPHPALLALPEATWRGRDLLAGLLGVAREQAIEVGLLRTERELRAPEDARALLADPLLPGDVRRVLSPPAPR